MVKKLFNKILKQIYISRSLEDTRHQNAILAVCWKNLVSLTPLEMGHLDRCHTAGRPACPPEASPFVTT
jgi:hypothetical protein